MCVCVCVSVYVCVCVRARARTRVRQLCFKSIKTKTVFTKPEMNNERNDISLENSPLCFQYIYSSDFSIGQKNTLKDQFWLKSTSSLSSCLISYMK